MNKLTNPEFRALINQIYDHLFLFDNYLRGKVSAKVQSIRMFLLCWVLRRKNALMWNDMYYRYFPKGTITSFQSVLSASNYASCIVGGIPKEGKLHKKSSSKKEICQNITWKKVHLSTSNMILFTDSIFLQYDAFLISRKPAYA